MMNGIKVLSLFDGISCGQVALNREGIIYDKYYASEVEKNAIEVTMHNYPNTIQLGDVFKIDYSTIGDIDLLLGGSPCTNWSIAKAGRDRETTSSGVGWELFMQYVRGLKETNPKYFIYENNESMSDEIKHEITKQLGVDPIMIDSADFSAQNRKRYYWTNIPLPKFGYEKSRLVIQDILFEHEYRIKDFSKYESTVKWNKDKTICSWDTSGKGYYSQANRCRKTTVKSNTLPASGNDKNNIYIDKHKCRVIHPIEAERLQTLPDNYTNILKSKVKRSEVCGNGWTVDVICYILRGLKDLI